MNPGRGSVKVKQQSEALYMSCIRYLNEQLEGLCLNTRVNLEKVREAIEDFKGINNTGNKRNNGGRKMRPKNEVSPAREAALKVLYEVDHKKGYANIVLNKVLEKSQLDVLDKNLATELVYGTIKRLNTIDWIVDKFANRPLERMTPWVRNILRMGIYQLFFLDRIPDAAVCDEAVKLTKKYGHVGTARFVNGILRSIIRQRDKITFPDIKKNPVEHIAITYSHPVWVVERWLARFGLAQTIALCAANNQTPPFVVRTNTLKTDRRTLQARLREEGIMAEESQIVPEGLKLSNSLVLVYLKPLHEGLCQVQDESSMLVAHVVAPQPGERVLDACGAPGGKTTHLAQLMQDRGEIVAVDIHAHKLKLTEENCVRLGIRSVRTICGDARQLHQEFAGWADRVLVDAPCSGLGVLRRKPDARWRKSKEQLAELPQLQLGILASAAQCLKPGGVLVYSTCTLESEENQGVLEKFLTAHPEFILDDLTPYLGPILPDGFKQSLDLEAGFVQFYPHVHGIDGFFIARLIKQQQ